MELRVDRYRMLIFPENKTDEAYLEEVFGLKNEGDKVQAIRVNTSGLNCWAYLEIKGEVKNVKTYTTKVDRRRTKIF